jgi:hypothetical protein
MNKKYNRRDFVKLAAGGDEAEDTSGKSSPGRTGWK